MLCPYPCVNGDESGPDDGRGDVDNELGPCAIAGIHRRSASISDCGTEF